MVGLLPSQKLGCGLSDSLVSHVVPKTPLLRPKTAWATLLGAHLAVSCVILILWVENQILAQLRNLFKVLQAGKNKAGICTEGFLLPSRGTPLPLGCNSDLLCFCKSQWPGLSPSWESK